MRDQSWGQALGVERKECKQGKFLINLDLIGRVRWSVPAIPASRRSRQEDCTFEASLDSVVRPCLENK